MVSIGAFLGHASERPRFLKNPDLESRARISDRGMLIVLVRRWTNLDRSWAEELIESRNLQLGLDGALERALELSNSTLGNIQLIDWTRGHLTIAAQCGFREEFLKFFEYVTFFDGSACSRAIRRRTQVLVDDVTADAEYASCRDIALRSGYRAVQSTPLISRSGAFVGMLSTHFPDRHRPSGIELNALLEFGQELAGKIILYRVRNRMARDVATLSEDPFRIAAQMLVSADHYVASVADLCAQTRAMIAGSRVALRRAGTQAED